MRFLARGQSSDQNDPILDLWIQFAGTLEDVSGLRWEVYDKTASPPTLSDAGTVDLVNDRIGVGHYFARYTVDNAESLGLHSIRWLMQREALGPEVSFEFDFDVLESRFYAARPMYGLISDARAIGISDTVANDQILLQLLLVASEQIDRFTSRTFGARGKVISVDGRGTPDLLLGEPIIGLEKIEVVSRDFNVDRVIQTELPDLGIYNRHLSQGLTDPDDRDNPKVSFFRVADYLGHQRQVRHANVFPDFIWTFGQQNVKLYGVFGYTDPNGSPQGDVPLLIRRACALLAARDLGQDPQIGGGSSMGGTSKPAGPIVEERTRDQSVKYASPGGGSSGLGGAGPGPFTGDPVIDNILLMYSRPATLGAA